MMIQDSAHIHSCERKWVSQLLCNRVWNVCVSVCVCVTAAQIGTQSSLALSWWHMDHYRHLEWHTTVLKPLEHLFLLTGQCQHWSQAGERVLNEAISRDPSAWNIPFVNRHARSKAADVQNCSPFRPATSSPGTLSVARNNFLLAHCSQQNICLPPCEVKFV